MMQVLHTIFCLYERRTLVGGKTTSVRDTKETASGDEGFFVSLLFWYYLERKENIFIFYFYLWLWVWICSADCFSERDCIDDPVCSSECDCMDFRPVPGLM